MKLDVAPKTFETIAREIQSDQGPVGIDAKKTHIIILDKLLQIEKRLDALEQQLKQK